MDEFKVLDVVALRRIWTPKAYVVEKWEQSSSSGNAGAFEVEFSDDSGKAYAFVALRPEQMMKLHFRKDEAA